MVLRRTVDALRPRGRYRRTVPHRSLRRSDRPRAGRRSPGETWMQLCLSTRTHPYRPLGEVLELLRPSGIAALDLAATPDAPHVPLGTTEAVDAVRPQLEGWHVAAIMADHPDFPRLRDEGQADAVTWTVGAIQAAAELRAPVVTTSLGSTGVDAWDAAWERSLDGLRTVLRRTAQSEVRLAVRLNTNNEHNSHRKEHRQQKSIPDPRLGIAYDTGLLHFLR